MADNNNDLFASIGGSLMKDLFEDLHVDEKDLFGGGGETIGGGMGWSLEQLEKELAHLETPQAASISAPPASSLPPPPGMSSAASLVVPQQQQTASGSSSGVNIGTATSASAMQANAVDAWSQSLEKFSQMSGLEQDFLAADTARKSSSHQKKPAVDQQQPDLSFLDSATDYDVSESVTLVGAAPPPGLAGPPGLLAPATVSITPAVPKKEKKELAVVEKKEKPKPKPQQNPRQQQKQPSAAKPEVVKEEEGVKEVKVTMKEPEKVPPIPQPKPFPPTPQNSMAEVPPSPPIPKSLPLTPQNSFNAGTIPPPGGSQPPLPQGVVAQQQQPVQQQQLPQQQQPQSIQLPPQVIAQLQAVQRQGAPPHVLAQMHAAAVQQHQQQMIQMQQGGGHQMMQPGVVIQQKAPPPPQQQQQQPPQQQQQQRPAGNVWNKTATAPTARTHPHPQQAQQQHIIPPPAAQRIYCQSHPSSQPIPAKVLESNFMKSRDIAYVLHSMLKPILMAGTSTDDYDIQLLLKQHHQAQQQVKLPPKPTGYNKTPNKKKKEEESEGSKDTNGDGGDDNDESNKVITPSLKFMQERSTLGHTARADVTRPRALIAAGAALNTSADDEHGEDKEKLEARKSRATLWKSRIYIDQAYQSFTSICDIWKKSTASSKQRNDGVRVVPHEELQPHMLRLFKYLGIKKKATTDTDVNNNNSSSLVQYEVDIQSLQLFMKLPKGRILLARILEQALLPPNAVQALLQPTLKVTLSSRFSVSDVTPAAMAARTTDDRLFCVLTQVLSGLPTLSNDILLDCAKVLLEYAPKESLATTRRMECVHSILRRGNVMSSAASVADNDSSSTFKKEWNTTEEQFLNVLGSM